jgi:hypothetical protein
MRSFQQQEKAPQTPTIAEDKQPEEMAAIRSQLPVKITLANWANFNDTQLRSIGIDAQRKVAVSPDMDKEQISALADNPLPLLLVVKAWEPPLGELADFMADTQGFIMPCDLQQGEIKKPASFHLQEWQRFAAEQKNWQIFLPDSWLSEQGAA